MIPKPDLMMTSGYLCEIAPKTVDLVHEFFDIPICCCDTCLDLAYNESRDADRRESEFAAKGMKNFVNRVEELVGFEVTDDMLLKAISAKSRLGSALGEMRRFIETSDPLVISPTNDSILSCLLSLPLSEENINEAVDAVNTLYQELRERNARGLGALKKGAPRVLAMLPMHHTDPRLEYLAGEIGIALIASNFAVNIPSGEILTDPYKRMSAHLRTSPYGTISKIPLVIDQCKRLNLDGVLDRYHAGCRAVSGDAVIIKQAVEAELGIPVLLMEWENFDPRVYKHEEFKRNLEMFKDILTQNTP
jgi:benzoyl-CoA reductase/2-hydroxyglutaryl-CoA dehydratase subunit BcrC/BadD/HgdB